MEDNGKTIAIVAHITLIGWIIALIMNNNDRKPFASYYLRQTLGIFLMGLVVSFIPILGWILWIAVFVFWLLSLINAASDRMEPVPLVGEYFQEWFRSL